MEINPLPDFGGTMDLKVLSVGFQLIFFTCNYRLANYCEKVFVAAQGKKM